MGAWLQQKLDGAKGGGGGDASAGIGAVQQLWRSSSGNCPSDYDR